MAKRPLELTPEAQSLIAQVTQLQEQLARIRQEVATEVAAVRAAATAEVSRVRSARWERAPMGTPERQASRLAAEIDRMAAESSRLGFERNRLAREVARLAEERDELLAVTTADGPAIGPNAERLAARDRGDLVSELDALRSEREQLRRDLTTLAASWEHLAAERDALVAESERVGEEYLATAKTRVEEHRALMREHDEAQLAATRGVIDQERAQLDADRATFEAAVTLRRQTLAESVAQAWAEYEWLRSELQANMLDHRDRPAPVAADAVRTKGREVAKAKREAKRAEWVVRFYEVQFPWLAELRDLEAEDDYVADADPADVDGADAEQDPARRWLSPEEFKALSDVERNQRALDRYLRSRKSSWQLGRDYERYIGYLREQDGWNVSYHGIFKGLEDLGRDLLAERDGRLEVIQCKRWAQHKTIHERHVFQLFGTVVAARIENPTKTVTGTFTTTTKLSERAHEFARQLEIRVEQQVPLADYPRIKCNIARRDDERIYHLPFDQQYDTTVIERERGERYVVTVAEAEALGFRRAWRWKARAQGTAD